MNSNEQAEDEDQMQNLSRRTVLVALSAPVAAGTMAVSLSSKALDGHKTDGSMNTPTDWRGIPHPEWKKETLDRS